VKYWVYLNGEVPGSYTPEELVGIPGVGETTMVCPSEGGIEERNWLRAGQFPDILDAIRRLERPPTAPQAPMPRHDIDPGRPLDPNDILTDSSSRLFRHVTDLMKELENRRAERAMTQSLQRQVIELKNEILAMRERNQYLQDRADLIPGFQDREQRLTKDFEALRQKLQEREAQLRGAEADLGKNKDALEKARRVESSAAEELKRQAEVIEDLSGQLAQKEFTLAKAFGVIRRLEEVMGDLLPSTVSGISSEVPGYKNEEAPPPPPPEDPPIQVRTRVSEPEPEPEPKPEPQPEQEPEPVSESSGRGPEPDPVIQELASSSYTADTGEPCNPMDLPAEGEVTPVPPPWTKLVERFSGFIKKSFSGSAPPEPPSAQAPPDSDDKTPDQN